MLTELFVDEKCIEINVTYERFENSVLLNCIEVVIAGNGINILPSLNDRQKQKIIDDLANEPTYEV